MGKMCLGLGERLVAIGLEGSLSLFLLLPSHHTVTLSDKIPLPLDAGALQNALDALGCVDSSWLTHNHLLYLWMQAALQDLDTFVLTEESFFSRNKAETLQEYCLGIRISGMLISDSLLQRQKPSLLTSIITDPEIHSQDIFPPAIIFPTDLCATLLRPLIYGTPPLTSYLLFPLSSLPSSAAKSSTYYTYCGTTLFRGIDFLHELPIHHTATPKQNSTNPTDMDVPPPLLHPLVRRKNTSPYPSTVLPIHHTPQDVSRTIHPNIRILFPLNETIDALLFSKNSLEASMSMSHCFKISFSKPLPNIVTNFLLKCGPIHGAFLNSHMGYGPLRKYIHIPPLPHPIPRFQSPDNPIDLPRPRTQVRNPSIPRQNLCIKTRYPPLHQCM